MATLTATSTIAEIVAEYRATASYYEDDDLAKARRFVTACVILLGRPEREEKGGRGGAAHEFNHEVLQQQKLDAQQFIAAKDATVNAAAHHTAADFRHFDARR